MNSGAQVLEEAAFRFHDWRQAVGIQVNHLFRQPFQKGALHTVKELCKVPYQGCLVIFAKLIRTERQTRNDVTSKAFTF